MMKNKLISVLAVCSLALFSADNEIYVDQSGTGANIDLEQLGISNIIGGLNSSAGNLTASSIFIFIIFGLVFILINIIHHHYNTILPMYYLV